MNLRNKLILAFLAATLVPLAAILWMSTRLFELSLDYSVTDELDRLSKSLEGVAREYYRLAGDSLKADASAGRVEGERFSAGSEADWPPFLEEFWKSGEHERFVLSKPDGARLNYLVRRDSEVRLYSRTLDGVRMEEITRQYRNARARVEQLRQRDLRRGFTYSLLLLSAVIWIISLASLMFIAGRISRPIHRLTAGLQGLAAGDLETRIASGRRDEIGRAIEAFNCTAGNLLQSRERLVYLSRIAGWQTLARKMAHELKNSLTPIRLTVEEILARRPEPDPNFLDQAARVVIDEVDSLERRVRAFSEFAAEPSPNPSALDVNALLEERVRFLEVAHPGVTYGIDAVPALPPAWADADQVKGILTNLLKNAAEAAGPGGEVLGMTRAEQGRILVEVHDSGPGLSEESSRSLFEPSVSFKQHGMGLGLSISRKNALLAGGDLLAVEGRLGGAGFRLLLPAAPVD